jgi:hypothetical protein
LSPQSQQSQSSEIILARKIFGRLLVQYNPDGGGGLVVVVIMAMGLLVRPRPVKKKNSKRRGLVRKNEMLLMKTLVWDSSWKTESCERVFKVVSNFGFGQSSLWSRPELATLSKFLLLDGHPEPNATQDAKSKDKEQKGPENDVRCQQGRQEKRRQEGAKKHSSKKSGRNNVQVYSTGTKMGEDGVVTVICFKFRFAYKDQEEVPPRDRRRRNWLFP